MGKRKLPLCIGTHNTEEIKGDNITRIHANLYLDDSKVFGRYEVDYSCLSTSGGVLSTCWNADEYTMAFDSLKEVDDYYGKGYFKPVVSRLPTMPHD